MMGRQEIPDARWRALVEIFRESSAPVHAAVRWVETLGYGGALGTECTQGNARGVLQCLARFVPEVLARPVVVIEEDEDKPGAVRSICNQLWMQTLPSAMQADIITFLSAERHHFLSKDLCALATTLLATGEADFWVRLAASNLLKLLQNGKVDHQSLFLEQDHALFQNAALDEYSTLPSWLEEYKGAGSIPVAGIPLLRKDFMMKDDESQVQNSVTLEKMTTNVTDKTVEQLAFVTEDWKRTTLGKRKHELEVGADLQDPSPLGEVQESEGLKKLLLEEITLEAVDDEEQNSAKGVLGDDLYAWAKSLGMVLQSRSSQEGLPPDIDIISRCANTSLILKVIKPWLADDETTNLLVGSLLGEQAGYAQSLQILTHLLLPKLVDLHEPPSRMLGMAVLQAGKAHPRATVDAVVLPLLLHPEGCSAVKCDVINRVVKECLSQEVVSSLCNKLFCTHAEEQKALSWVWGDGTVGVVHILLSQKVSLEDEALGGLIALLEQHSNQFSASLKFSNLLLTLVTKYGLQVRPYKALLQHVVKITKTFLTKSIMTKLSAL